MEGRRWEDLEMDCLVHVFQRVRLQDLTLAVPFVCHSWHMAALSPQCWNALNFSGLDFDTCSSPFAERIKLEYRLKYFSFTGLLKLSIHRSGRSAVQLLFPDHTAISTEDLVYLSNECPRLRVLVLPKLREEEEKLLPKLMHKWNDLEWLSTQFLSTSFQDIVTEIGQHCKNFAGLYTLGWVLNKEASALVTFLPKIKYLNLSGSFLSNRNLLMILDRCKELEELHVKFCAGFTIDAEILRRSSGLKTFDYTGSSVEFLE